MTSLFQCFSRIPSAAVRRELDGHLYTYIPHKLVDGRIEADFQKPQLVRADDARCFQKGGERYIWFASVGSALLSRICPPFGVSVLPECDALLAALGYSHIDFPGCGGEAGSEVRDS